MMAWMGKLKAMEIELRSWFTFFGDERSVWTKVTTKLFVSLADDAMALRCFGLILWRIMNHEKLVWGKVSCNPEQVFKKTNRQGLQDIT